VSAHQEKFEVRTPGRGTQEITAQVTAIVGRSGIRTGLATVFVHHTSASLVIYENADPSARADLETFLARIAPENAPWFTHTLEGPDDMPSHLRMTLTRTSETVPVRNGAPDLGTWQGIFLYEHRRAAHRRTVSVTVVGD
jgi:secondary thiamine-phosphate synthase enzyme